MATKRKSNAEWEELAREIEEEDKSERSGLEKFWDQYKLERIHSKILGSGGFMRNQDNFLDAVAGFWDQFKKHSICNRSKDPPPPDAALEISMQYWHDKACIYFHLYEYQVREGHFGKVDPMEVAAMVDKKEKFLNQAFKVAGKWLKAGEWQNDFPKHLESYIDQYKHACTVGMYKDAKIEMEMYRA